MKKTIKIFITCVLLIGIIPGYILIKDIQNDMPLREYVQVTLLPRLKTDLKRFFTFSGKIDQEMNIPVLYLEISDEELAKLEEMRNERLDEYAKTNKVKMGQKNWEYVNGKVVLDNNEYLIKIRIRGDMPSNYNRGLEKASYRFNIESESTLFGKKKLSLVRCFLENNFFGYLFSQFMSENGFVANDIRFVRLYFNNSDAGIVFLEEGFSKELIESANYKEGIIARFKNDCIDNNNIYNPVGVPNIVAYEEKSILKDTILKKLYSECLSKIDLLKTGAIKTQNVFNIDLFAKYYALCDLFLAHHSYVCHNAKLYYNPENKLFEPIAWDPSSFTRYNVSLPVLPGYNELSGKIYQNSNFPIHQFLFTDTLFLKKFNNYLYLFSSDTRISDFIKKHEDLFSYLDPILYRQRFQEEFKPDKLLKHIKYVNNFFSTEGRLNVKYYRNENMLVVNSCVPIAIQLTDIKIDNETIYINKLLMPYKSDSIYLGNININPGENKFSLFSTIYGLDMQQKDKGLIFDSLEDISNPAIASFRIY